MSSSLSTLLKPVSTLLGRIATLLQPLAGACKRLTRSTFLLTVACLLSISLLIDFYNPLDLLFFTGLTTIRQNNMVSKLPKILNGNENPQILILGSSLSLYPMSHLDDMLKEKRTRWDSTYVRYHIVPYARADYMARRLSEQLGSNISIVNASIVGSVISDQCLILEKYLKTGKKPEVIVVFIAPRDFLHDNRSQVGTSPTFEILADVQNIPDLIGRGDWRGFAEFMIGKTFSFYAAKRDYKHVLVSAASRITGHPPDFFVAAAVKGERTANIFEVDKFWESEAVWDQPPNKLRQLDEYKAIYSPFDYKRFATQEESFKKLLSLAQTNGIEVCVVSMPLTRENLALIPGTGLQEYEKFIRSACTAANTMLLEPAQTESYQLADFEDCAHLNVRGGTKFVNSVVKEMCRNRRVAMKLSGKDNMIGAAAQKQKGASAQAEPGTF